MKSTKPVLSICFGFLCLCILGGCNNSKVRIPEKNFTTTPVKKWICLGPFRFDTISQDPTKTFYTKDLEKFGIDEALFEKSDFKKVPKTINTFEIEDKQGTVDLIKYAGEDKLELSSFYLFSEVESEVDKEVVFITDGSFGYTIWLNEELVISDYWKKNTNKGGDRFIPVKLKKGTNKIFAKVNRGNNELSWKLNLTISNVDEAKKVFFENCLSDFIANPNFLDTLNIYVGPHFSGSFEISDTENKVVLNQSFSGNEIHGGYVKLKNLEKITEGFYTLKLIVNEYTIEEKIYKGDLANAKSRFERNILDLTGDSSYRNEIATSIQKFNYLIDVKPDSLSRYEKQYWKNNSVFYGFNTNKSINYLTQNKDLKGCSGTLIKSYYSKNEDKTFNFLFHCSGSPEEIASKPVILMIPYALEGNDFTTSWYFSSLDQLQIDAHLAEKNGFSIAWLFSRGSDYSIENADDDALGVINTLISDYNIDAHKFYVDGDCVGGYRALLIASRNPDKFAGIAAHGPVTQGENGYGPINLVRNLFNVPICIVHGHEDAVVPIQQTKLYISEANKFEVYPVLDEKFNKGKHSLSKAYHFDSFNKLKEFYTHSKMDLPTTIKYCTYEKANKSIYWLDIKPQYTTDLAEISIEKDSKKPDFKIESTGIEEISINTEMLKIDAKSTVTIYSNKKQIFSGLVVLPRMDIRLN
jgi:predicted esterase